MNKSFLFWATTCGLVLLIGIVSYVYIKKETTMPSNELAPVVETQNNAPASSTITEKKADVGSIKQDVPPPAKLIDPIKTIQSSSSPTSPPAKIPLLTFEKIPSSRTYSSSIKEIPFKLYTKIPSTELGKYQLCTTVLENRERTSETDCTVIVKNLAYNMLISLEDLNLAPSQSDKPYYEGVHQLELLYTLIKNDSNLAYKITGDESIDLKILKDSAIETASSGIFTIKGE